MTPAYQTFRALAVAGMLLTTLHATLRQDAARTGHLHLFPVGGVALRIDHTGLYCVTGAFLRSRGFDWTGIRRQDLAVVHDGVAVLREVSPGAVLDASSWIGFYAVASPTLYASYSIYDLVVDPHRAAAPAVVPAAPGHGPAPASYQGRYVESRRSVYDPLAEGDPWFFTQIASTGSPAAASDRIRLSRLVPHRAASLSVVVRGVSNLPGTGPQHHVVVLVNRHRVAETRFSGTGLETMSASIPAAFLRPDTEVRFLLPGDVHNAETADVVDVQTLTLRYRRAFVAGRGRLTVSIGAASPRIAVAGLRSTPISIWRVTAMGEERLAGFSVRRVGPDYRLAFAAPSAGTYVVADGRALVRPSSARAIQATGYLLRGRARLVVIAPRSFEKALAPLVAYHRAHGTAVKLAGVQDIYTRYSAGVPDPAAITRYLADARTRLGTRNVLLVGGDTDDYHHYLHCSPGRCPANPADRSVIPSPYARDAFFGQIPSDEWYVAGQSSGPNLGIGRIPAVTAGQVSIAVSRTLGLLHGLPGTRSVFAAGGGDAGFGRTSDALAMLLPRAWSVDRAYTGRLAARAARQRLLRAIARGPALVNYVGHGNLEQWGKPPPLLTVDDVPHLRNRPTLFLDWGCQTAYAVDPADAPLNARLLFAPHGGAALTLGSTGLDEARPQAELATAFFAELFRDPAVTTIGEALQRAEDAALAADGATIGPVQSYELFGDPALPLSALRRGQSISTPGSTGARTERRGTAVTPGR